MHQRNSAIWLEKYRSEIFEKQKNSARKLNLGMYDFCTWGQFYVWFFDKNLCWKWYDKNILYVMIWLVSYAQKKNSTTYVLSKHSLGSNCARCISEKIYCAKSLCDIYNKKVCFSGQIRTYEKISRGKCYVYHGHN